MQHPIKNALVKIVERQISLLDFIIDTLHSSFKPQVQLVGFEANTGVELKSSIFSWDGFLFAAPKRKNSVARRKLRHQDHWIRPMLSLDVCKECGNKKIHNYLCAFCFPKFSSYVINKDKKITFNRLLDKQKGQEGLLKKPDFFKKEN